jgi:hypothetical protein
MHGNVRIFGINALIHISIRAQGTGSLRTCIFLSVSGERARKCVVQHPPLLENILGWLLIFINSANGGMRISFYINSPLEYSLKYWASAEMQLLFLHTMNPGDAEKDLPKRL